MQCEAYMDINSIQQMQKRIAEIKSRFAAIQKTYNRISPSEQTTVQNTPNAMQQNTNQQPDIKGTIEQKNNTFDNKITEEILKSVLYNKADSKASSDMQQIQNLLKKAISQYTSKGDLFNIEE